jgi:SAM-dependent methyltransferase
MSKESNDCEWFVSWFDTPYYHTLYQYRDDTEARIFIDRLFEALRPQRNDHILDLACGRGRHAVYMNQKGYRVTGIDLSSENISYASGYKSDTLDFLVKDMRENMGMECYDWVFNLFTSFGYFSSDSDHYHAMHAIAACLKPGGKLVLDFMNASKVAKNLVPEEIKNTSGIEFHIKRYVNGKQIVKEITFFADGKNHRYEECVRKLSLNDFELMFQAAGLVPVIYFGSLHLEPFNEATSDRLIMIVEKK